MNKQAVDPKWWKYQITDEQAEAIKRKDHDAMRKFWADNEDLVRSIVHKRFFHYLANGEMPYIVRQYEPLDAICQIYADLPLYKYRDSKTLYSCMLRSIKYCNCGGYAHKQQNSNWAMSLEAPFNATEYFGMQNVLAGANGIEDCMKASDEYLYKMEALFEQAARAAFPKSKELQKQFLLAL